MLHFSNFESSKFLGGKLIYFSSLEFEIQKDCDSETSEFKLDLFRAFQRHLTNKNPTPSRGTASILQFSARSFSTYIFWQGENHFTSMLGNSINIEIVIRKG